MRFSAYVANALHANLPVAPAGHFYYKTVACCADIAEVRAALKAAHAGGFGVGQVSLLVREKEYWHTVHEGSWGAAASGETAGTDAAHESLPDFVQIAGITFHGGIGLMASGPIVAALTAVGLDAIGGSPLPGGAGRRADDESGRDTDKEVEAAIGTGYWVVVIHSHDEAEAARAQSLLAHNHTIREPTLSDRIG